MSEKRAFTVWITEECERYIREHYGDVEGTIGDIVHREIPSQQKAKAPAIEGKQRSLEQILLDRGFIKAHELKFAQEAALRTGKRLVETLLNYCSITPETLATVLSFQYGAPIIDLKQFDIQPQALALIPEQMARENNILPLAVDGDVLTVAMEDPGDFQLMDTLSSLSRKRIRPVIPLHGDIRASIDTHYSSAVSGRVVIGEEEHPGDLQ